MGLEMAFETGRLYQPLVDIADAERNVHSAFTLLPGLRGFWPMSAIDASGNAMDHSVNGQMLTYNGNGMYDLDNAAPYIALDGAGDYLSHVDIGLYDILGTESYVNTALRGLTFGGWFYHAGMGDSEAYISKYSVSGNLSYYLLKNTADKVQFIISSNGTALTSMSLDREILVETWTFAVGRFIPGASQSVFVNSEVGTASTTVTSIFNSNAPLQVGNGANNAHYLEGRASLCFLCAAALPSALIGNLYQVSRKLFGV